MQQFVESVKMKKFTTPTGIVLMIFTIRSWDLNEIGSIGIDQLFQDDPPM